MDERTQLWEAFDRAGRRLQDVNTELAEAERIYGEAARALDAYDTKQSDSHNADTNGFEVPK